MFSLCTHIAFSQFTGFLNQGHELYWMLNFNQWACLKYFWTNFRLLTYATSCVTVFIWLGEKILLFFFAKLLFANLILTLCISLELQTIIFSSPLWIIHSFTEFLCLLLSFLPHSDWTVLLCNPYSRKVFFINLLIPSLVWSFCDDSRRHQNSMQYSSWECVTCICNCMLKCCGGVFFLWFCFVFFSILLNNLCCSSDSHQTEKCLWWLWLCRFFVVWISFS